MLSVIPFCLIICCICLNCPSANIAFILYPHAWYAYITCSIDVTSVLFFMSLTSSVVLKCILRDVTITNGILLMNNISIAIAITLCFYIISCGISCKLTSTCFWAVHVIFPFTDLMLGPNMSSTLSMSCLVTGQLGIRFLST